MLVLRLAARLVPTSQKRLQNGHLDLRSFSLSDNLLALLAKSDGLDGLQQLRARNVFALHATREAVLERFGARFFIDN